MTIAPQRIAIALACALAGAAASALTVPELQALLRTAPIRSIPFNELRESPWLAVPIESRGTLHSTPESLEKRILTPRQETWRLLVDRMEWVDRDGVAVKHVLYSEAPAVAALANALRHVVAADLVSLTRDFQVELAGDERQWTAQLQPREATVGRYLDHIELQGTGPRLQVIIVVERQGERTTTRLQP
jgi:hypothetical protein